MWVILALAAFSGEADASLVRETAEIGSILARHKTPVVVKEGQPAVPGAFSTQTIKVVGNCEIRVTETVPAFKSPTYTNAEPMSFHRTINLSTMEQWQVRDTSVSIAPTYPPIPRLRTASTADAAKVKQILDRLAKACYNSVPQPDPPDTGGVSDLISIRHGQDYRTCKFRRVPGLSLSVGTSYPKYSFFAYDKGETYIPEILIIERDDYIYDYSADSSYVQWGNLRVNPRFSITNEELRANKIVKAEVTVDGRPLVSDWLITHNKNAFGSGFAGIAKVELSRRPKGEHGKVVAAMAAGRTVMLTLHDSGGLARSYTFDASPLRDMPRALEGAKFSCD